MMMMMMMIIIIIIILLLLLNRVEVMKLQNLHSTREELNHGCVINVNDGCV